MSFALKIKCFVERIRPTIPILVALTLGFFSDFRKFVNLELKTGKQCSKKGVNMRINYLICCCTSYPPKH